MVRASRTSSFWCRASSTCTSIYRSIASEVASRRRCCPGSGTISGRRKCGSPSGSTGMAAPRVSGRSSARALRPRWSTDHPLGDSAHAVLSDLEPLCIKGGDVLMDRNGPDAVLRGGADAALIEASEHIATYGERYVLPRGSCHVYGRTDGACGRLPTTTDARMQTHLSENLDEIARVKELYPESTPTPRSTRRRVSSAPNRCSATASTSTIRNSACWPTRAPGWPTAPRPTSPWVAVACRWSASARPTSRALATDVGAGPELSMLHVIATFLAVHAGFVDVSPTEGLPSRPVRGALHRRAGAWDAGGRQARRPGRPAAPRRAASRRGWRRSVGAHTP